MPTGPIVEALNIFKGNSSRVWPRLEVLAVNTFIFEAMKETLQRCMIIAIARPTHADLNALLRQDGLIAFTCVGASSVWMME